MLRSWRGAVSARFIFEDRLEKIVDIVLLRNNYALAQGYPCTWDSQSTVVYIYFKEPTLIFAITSLDLLVRIQLHFLLQDSCSCWLVQIGNFEYVCCIYPVV